MNDRLPYVYGDTLLRLGRMEAALDESGRLNPGDQDSLVAMATHIARMHAPISYRTASRHLLRCAACKTDWPCPTAREVGEQLLHAQRLADTGWPVEEDEPAEPAATAREASGWRITPDALTTWLDAIDRPLFEATKGHPVVHDAQVLIYMGRGVAAAVNTLRSDAARLRKQGNHQRADQYESDANTLIDKIGLLLGAEQVARVYGEPSVGEGS